MISDMVLLCRMCICRNEVGVNLYTWNRVSVFRVNQHGALSLNGGRPVEGHSAGHLTQLNLPMTIFIGGRPANYRRHKSGSDGAAVGFHGAIQRVCSRVLIESMFSVIECVRAFSRFAFPTQKAP